MLVIVANIMALASLVGPSQAATRGGWPRTRSRLMASPATTGSSTRSPSAMISVAIETCCKSIPSINIMPYVMASVSGIEMAMRRGARHDQIVRQMLPHGCEGLLDSRAKLADLLARAHLHRQRDGARTLPVALG